MTATYYYANKLLGKGFGGTDFDEPTTIYFGICTACAKDGTITGEPSGGAYARVAATNDTNLWTTAASGAITTKIDIEFPRATGDWGTGFDVIFISDASTGNTNTLMYGTMASLDISNEDKLKFPSGDIDITL